MCEAQFFFKIMQFQFFKIPVDNSQEQTNEMNAFLRGHKIVSVEKNFVSNNSEAYWGFCIKYIVGSAKNTFSTKKEKIDYRAVLDDKAFVIFSELRKIRKQFAVDDAVPAYAVFTDEELSKIAQLQDISFETVKKIKGIGEKKMEKYGKLMIQKYKDSL